MTLKVGLVMIVKNEEKVLPRLAASLKGVISSYTIIDTGSTDDTMKVARREFGKYCDGHVFCVAWQGYSHARNRAIELEDSDADFLLTMDADEVFRGILPPVIRPDTDVIYAKQVYGIMEYWLPRLWRRDKGVKWVGRAHEYLDVGNLTSQDTKAFSVIHMADGGNRGNKLERERNLLMADWEENRNGRTAFYLGRTYDDMGDTSPAIEWYTEAIKLCDWNQEVFYAMWRQGVLNMKTNPHLGVGQLFEAWEYLPERLEPLYTLANYYRTKNYWGRASLVLRAANPLHITKPEGLFVHTDVYRWGFLFELSIVGYYNKDTYDQGKEAQMLLEKMNDLPPEISEAVLLNGIFYR
jgi:glycosyltransferase involved in cell wall biosynthesis